MQHVRGRARTGSLVYLLVCFVFGGRLQVPVACHRSFDPVVQPCLPGAPVRVETRS